MDGVLVIDARAFRTQGQNREDARQRLAELLRQASIRPRKRRKRVLGSPEEVEAMLEEEERQSVNAESLAEMFTEVREQKATEVAAAVAGDES